MVVAAEGGQVQVVILGYRAALEQQPHERVVVRAAGWPCRRRAVERRATAPAEARVQVRAGVQQQPGRGEQARGAGQVEDVPAGRAHGVQRGPSSRGIGTDGGRRIARDLVARGPGLRSPSIRAVARLCPAISGVWASRRTALSGPVTDAGYAELGAGQLIQAGGARLDLGLESGPAGEPVRAGDHELRSRLAWAGPRPPRPARQPPRRPDLAARRKILGLAPELIEAGVGLEESP